VWQMARSQWKKLPTFYKANVRDTSYFVPARFVPVFLR
jgi:hypothetical protein